MQIQKKIEQTAGMKMVRAFVFGMIVGVLAWLASNILFAAAATAIDCSETVLNVMTMLGIAAAGFAAGAAAAKKIGKKGLLVGGVIGSVFAALLLLIGLIACQLTAFLWMKLAAVLFFSACGGIFGVNGKKRHK